MAFPDPNRAALYKEAGQLMASLCLDNVPRLSTEAIITGLRAILAGNIAPGSTETPEPLAVQTPATNSEHRRIRMIIEHIQSRFERHTGSPFSTASVLSQFVALQEGRLDIIDPHANTRRRITTQPHTTIELNDLPIAASTRQELQAAGLVTLADVTAFTRTNLLILLKPYQCDMTSTRLENMRRLLQELGVESIWSSESGTVPVAVLARSHRWDKLLGTPGLLARLSQSYTTLGDLLKAPRNHLQQLMGSQTDQVEEAFRRLNEIFSAFDVR